MKSFSHKWYKWAAWTKGFRVAQLQREPICEMCLAEYKLDERARLCVATVVHHKIDFRNEQGDSWALFSDPKNHQSLCKSHHDHITASRRGKVAAPDGVVPTGAPGKQFTTGADIDIDALMADVADLGEEDLLKHRP